MRARQGRVQADRRKNRRADGAAGNVAPEWIGGRLMLRRPVPEAPLPMVARLTHARPSMMARGSRRAVFPGGSVYARYVRVLGVVRLPTGEA